MTISNSSIKKISRDILKSNYIGCIIVTAIFLTAFFICYNISALLLLVAGTYFSVGAFAVLCFFVLAPLLMGVIRYFWRLSCGTADNPVAVFYYFSSAKIFIKTLKLVFSLGLRTALSYLVFSIPTIALKVISGSWLYSVLNMPIPIWTVNLTGVISILHLIAFIATFFSVIKYYLAPMLFVADENIDTEEAMHLSTVISKRTLLDYIFLLFSFIGWLLLCLLIIPLIFIVPYILISYLVHCSYAVNTFNEEITKINHDDIPTFIAGV